MKLLGQFPSSPRGSGKASISPGRPVVPAVGRSPACVHRLHSLNPALVAPPAGRGAAGPAHAVRLPHGRPCWSTPGRVQLAVFLSPADPILPRADRGAQTSGCCPPLSPGLPRSRIRLRVRLWSAHAALWSSFPSSGYLPSLSCSRPSRFLRPTFHPTVQMRKLRPRV